MVWSLSNCKNIMEEVFKLGIVLRCTVRCSALGLFGRTKDYMNIGLCYFYIYLNELNTLYYYTYIFIL